MTRKIKNTSVNSTTACPVEQVKLIKTFRLRRGEHKSTDIYRTPKKVALIILLFVRCLYRGKNPYYIQSLVKQIQFAGLKPIVAVTGEGGLRMVEESYPDLILLEMELPDMNGLRFVSAIRRNPEADRVPIVAMSAFPELKSMCLDHGCNDFLLKPVKMIDLVAHIKKFLH